jgi:hypothetical protein
VVGADPIRWARGEGVGDGEWGRIRPGRSARRAEPAAGPFIEAEGWESVGSDGGGWDSGGRQRLVPTQPLHRVADWWVRAAA